MENNRIKEINEEINKLRGIIDDKRKKWDYSKSYDEYILYLRPETKQISELGRELRMIMPYKLEDLPKYGDVMSLSDFIENVNCGGFIDYDGYGNYVIDNKMTDIEIYPSDVEYGTIRKDFDTIIWFNR